MDNSRFRPNEAEQHKLRDGAAALGVELDATAIAALGQFADLLGVWNQKMNLIACATAADFVDRHLLDSLAVEPLLPEMGTLVDLGSGAGFPGIPLAVARPTHRILLVEARRRRASFLREVKRQLKLFNLEIREQRAELPPTDSSDLACAVVTRAVWPNESAIAAAKCWLVESGRLFWMRTEPLCQATANVTEMLWERRVQYRIGSGRTRTIEIFRKVR